jgi:hypothetical protein
VFVCSLPFALGWTSKVSKRNNNNETTKLCTSFRLATVMAGTVGAMTLRVQNMQRWLTRNVVVPPFSCCFSPAGGQKDHAHNHRWMTEAVAQAKKRLGAKRVGIYSSRYECTRNITHDSAFAFPACHREVRLGTAWNPDADFVCVLFFRIVSVCRGQHNNCVSMSTRSVSASMRPGADKLFFWLWCVFHPQGLVMGTAKGPTDLPLWYAAYDGHPSFANFGSFGGWSHPSMKQFAGQKHLTHA